jgi:hypothetical protein
MTMTSRLLAVVAAALLGAGCLVDIHQVSDPEPAFAAARREAALVEGRSGPPESLNILVYDRKEARLVRASVPLWIVDELDEEEIDLGGEIDLDDETAQHVHRHLRLGDLKDAPLGPLVEVDEEDGDQVLVWLK